MLSNGDSPSRICRDEHNIKGGHGRRDEPLHPCILSSNLCHSCYPARRLFLRKENKTQYHQASTIPNLSVFPLWGILQSDIVLCWAEEHNSHHLLCIVKHDPSHHFSPGCPFWVGSSGNKEQGRTGKNNRDNSVCWRSNAIVILSWACY
uniref:Uncharacterized protein n=1 Tax=Opuntia streptacantha TaxID=393608 RepID=A0A7C9DF92_OPUST